MTAPAEGALRILKLEPVDFCCGEVLAESQIWVLAEDRTGKRLSRRIPATKAAELGCRIDKAYAGNGYGTEAFAAVAEWGLYKIHLSRVVAKCYKENQASYKMLSDCMRKKGEDDTFFYFEKLV